MQVQNIAFASQARGACERSKWPHTCLVQICQILPPLLGQLRSPHTHLKTLGMILLGMRGIEPQTPGPPALTTGLRGCPLKPRTKTCVVQLTESKHMSTQENPRRWYHRRLSRLRTYRGYSVTTTPCLVSIGTAGTVTRIPRPCSLQRWYFGRQPNLTKNNSNAQPKTRNADPTPPII